LNVFFLITDFLDNVLPELFAPQNLCFKTPMHVHVGKVLRLLLAGIFYYFICTVILFPDSVSIRPTILAEFCPNWPKFGPWLHYCAPIRVEFDQLAGNSAKFAQFLLESSLYQLQLNSGNLSIIAELILEQKFSSSKRWNFLFNIFWIFLYRKTCPQRTLYKTETCQQRTFIVIH
jgi:hypothetical protein